MGTLVEFFSRDLDLGGGDLGDDMGPKEMLGLVSRKVDQQTAGAILARSRVEVLQENEWLTWWNNDWRPVRMVDGDWRVAEGERVLVTLSRVTEVRLSEIVDSNSGL